MRNISAIGTANIIYQFYHDKAAAFQRTVTEIHKLSEAGYNPREYYPKLARETGLDTYKLNPYEQKKIEKELDLYARD